MMQLKEISPDARLEVPASNRCISESAYLLILMLISVNFFHFYPISMFTSNDICLVLFLAWLWIGRCWYYRPEENSVQTVRFYSWPIVMIWIGIIISFFAAWALYEQSFFTSFIASRTMLSMLALPAIGMMNPNINHVWKASTWFSVILLVFALSDAVGIPVIDREFLINPDNPKDLIEEDDFVICLSGFHWLPISLFFFLDKLKQHLNIHDFCWSLFLLGGIFLLQNRTVLFISSLIIVYVCLTLKSDNHRQMIFFRVAAVTVILGFIAFTMSQWIILFTETANQLDDDNYNRILAYDYFLFEACPSFIYYLTGTGFISANVNSILQDLMAVGIYNSDVGFVGFWNYYGVLPIIVFITFIIKGFHRNQPYYVKFNTIFMMVGSLTIACFNTIDKILWLCIFIYIVIKPKEDERNLAI